MITVSIISPEVSLQAINRVIEQNDFGCIFHKYVYRTLEEITGIYYQCKDNCDIIFCSGEFGYYQLMNIPDIEKPCAFVSYETKHFLAIALDFVQAHPEIPLNRIYCDFLVPSNNYLDLHRYLRPELMPFCCTEPVLSYDSLFSTAKRLWEQGKIDIAFVRSTNSLKRYEEARIPYLYIFPDDNTIADSIRSAVQTAKLRLTPAVLKAGVLIRLICPDGISGMELEYRRVSLLKSILDFRKERGLSFSVQTFVTCFQLSLELEDSSSVFDILRSLLLFLNREGEFSFRLGAGLSYTLERSFEQAERALSEAVRYGRSDGFLLNEQLRLIGPLSSPEPLRYSCDNEKIEAFSRIHGIHAANLQKILGLFLREPGAALTSSMLSEWLNITPRSCNRIIQKLCSCGLLREGSAQNRSGQPAEKGRPVKTYCFDEAACFSAFF